MAKKVMTVIKLQCPAGKATPAPPIGPALGQHGMNIMDFCKTFNSRTAHQMGDIIPVEITVFVDRTFEFICKSPPASSLIKRAAGLDSGSGSVGAMQVGEVTWDQVRDIAKKKMEDLNARDLDAAAKIVAGTARSMGVEVVDEPTDTVYVDPETTKTFVAAVEGVIAAPVEGEEEAETAEVVEE